MAGTPPWIVGLQVGVVLAVIGSVLVIRSVDPGGWGRRLRSRLLLGIPWGSGVSVVGVLLVYLYVQGGAAYWGQPMTVPFRAWSYFYPLGMLVAPFAHAGPDHLVGNLVGAAVLGPVAELVWGHFPRRRGSSSFGSPATNPYVRAFVLFPAGVTAVALATSLLSWGPVIGFSGVVFAFLGFALVRYPLGTVVALIAERAVRTAVRALQEPVLFETAEPSFARPWWAGIAIQAHLLGLMLGVVAAALLLRRRDRFPSASRLWAGTVVLAFSLSLWAIWWFRGGETFVLYRGPGVAFVLALGLLVALGVRATLSGGEVLEGFRHRDLGLLALVFPILVIGFVAVPLNLVTLADPTPPGDGPTVEVRDYTVVYAVDVQDRMVSVVNLSAFGETTAVNTSGAIVVSEKRHIWTRALSESQLAFRGRGTVRVGGLGWRRSVTFRRSGWSVAGNRTAYVVDLRPQGGEWRHGYASAPSTADPILEGRNVTVVPTAEGFVLDVSRRNTTIDRTPLPAPNGTAAAGGLRFVRRNETIYAAVNRTRVRIATAEEYHPA